jgi:hypothetical protein
MYFIFILTREKELGRILNLSPKPADEHYEGNRKHDTMDA